jgi:deoxyribonuclease V
VAGLDVAYAVDSDRIAAAVVVLDSATLQPVDSAVAVGEATFPYVPGLLAFRELPILVSALERLTVVPELLVCDGQGIAHPTRFGLACHVGLLTDLPTIGVAKTVFVGEYGEPGLERGDFSALRDGDDVIGRVLRTRPGVKPVFVSVGHRIDLDTATARVLELSPKYRLPETTRQADHLSRATLRDSTA